MDKGPFMLQKKGSNSLNALAADSDVSLRTMIKEGFGAVAKGK